MKNLILKSMLGLTLLMASPVLAHAYSCSASVRTGGQGGPVPYKLEPIELIQRPNTQHFDGVSSDGNYKVNVTVSTGSFVIAEITDTQKNITVEMSGNFTTTGPHYAQVASVDMKDSTPEAPVDIAVSCIIPPSPTTPSGPITQGQ